MSCLPNCKLAEPRFAFIKFVATYSADWITSVPQIRIPCVVRILSWFLHCFQLQVHRISQFPSPPTPHRSWSTGATVAKSWVSSSISYYFFQLIKYLYVLYIKYCVLNAQLAGASQVVCVFLCHNKVTRRISFWSSLVQHNILFARNRNHQCLNKHLIAQNIVSDKLQIS